ncbi:unnamed protein product [Paramecium pentaurelia]|uniref:Peptidase C1A papain C-terminal domain-containing protein n=1 Tax=Paramecium pentaurelia TaxID=43138 RepID=A0A8S1WS05_9CILI|nr:unnamed protein product [Paramecium pentaurelia]
MIQFICLIISLVSARNPFITAFVNSIKTTWTAVNYERWNDKSEEFYSKFFNVIVDHSDPIQYKYYENLEALPSSFSAYEKWPGCSSIKLIHDQGNCGSCWAVSAVSTMTDRLCIASGQTDKRQISAEDLLSCCGINCGDGCDGGYPMGAWKYFKIEGIVTGGIYNDFTFCKSYSFPPCSHGNNSGKYSKCDEDIFMLSNTPLCSRKCHSQSYRTYEVDKIKSRDNPYQLIRDQEQIKNEIYLNGPVQAVFLVYDDFLSYKSGVYQYTTGSLRGRHAVKIIGWGTENGIPYWEVVNSWNDGWGINGKFKILRGSNHLGIEENVIASII